MKSLSLSSLHLPGSGHWRTHARHLVQAARPAESANHRLEPHGYSFDDSRHPVWAIANGIAIFFLVMCFVSSFVLLADAFWTRA